jgi:hypothetical protein
MHNKFSCGHTVLENNLRENSSLSYLFTKPTKQVFKFVRTKTETCALKLETIRGPSALSVYMSNLWLQGSSMARMHLPHSQSTGTTTGTAAPARDQKLQRSGAVQNNISFRYKDAVTSFFRSGQV